MIIISILLTCAIIIIVQRNFYAKKGLDSLSYKAEYSSDCAFVDDDLYLYETLSNEKNIPIPYLKVNTDIEEGLTFTLISDSNDEKIRRLKETGTIQSVFVMKSHTSIKRRWRIRCVKRGVYQAPRALLIVSDIFGINTSSRRSDAVVQSEEGKYSRIVVLPKTIDLSVLFRSDSGFSGDVISNHCPVTDPFLRSGSREYTSSDPMNRINWKSTAVHSRLMVNIEERTVNRRFGVILNMNTRPIERNPEVPCEPGAIEQNITVAASIIESASNFGIPIRFFVNTTPSEVFDTPLCTIANDEKSPSKAEITASKILASDAVSDKNGVMDLLYILSFIEMKISIPAEAMFDHLCANTEYYGDCDSFVVVSSYIDERMLNAHRILRERGINLIFYLTTGRNDSNGIPDDVEVYYRTY